MRFQPDRRPSKWGATAAIVHQSTVEDVVAHFSGAGRHPFDGLVRLCDVTEIKGYRYCLLQVSLDFAYPAFPAIAEVMDEVGGTEFQLIVVETPESSVYLIVDKHNLPEDEERVDHPLIVGLAEWLGRALAAK